jgi:hypothetical protein
MGLLILSTQYWLVWAGRLIDPVFEICHAVISNEDRR